MERLAATEIALRKTVQELEERRERSRRELTRLQNEIANAHEDEDTSYAERQCEEAEDALAEIRRWQRAVGESAESYKREALRLEELGTATSSEARAFLRRILDDLAAYFALQTDGAAVVFKSDEGTSAPGFATSSAPRETFDPTSFSLPPGFQWVPISEIDTAKELANLSTEKRTKPISYEDMQHGYDTLRTKILPAINDPAHPADKDTFRDRDTADAVPHEKGILRIYEAFFGNDPIHLDRGRSDKLFSIDGGRHRIKVAMDAGWTAVPVKTTDLHE
ncbi:MAG TPA: hypothetical protein VGG15_06975 [Terriglobales bacterium]